MCCGLAGNGIEEGGCVAMAEAIKINKTIVHLNLSGELGLAGQGTMPWC